MRLARHVVSAVLLLCLPGHAGTPAAHYAIGTGSMGATFYPMAVGLCQYISTAALGFTCEAVESPGSRYNLEALQRGKFDLVLSQTGLQYRAWSGVAPFDQPHDRLRTVAPLHREVFILAVRRGLAVSRLSDIKGKRLSIGNEGSGSRVITERLLRYLGYKQSDFEIYDTRSADLGERLCNGEIDAAIYSTGHPNAIYGQMIEQCHIALVNLWDEEIEGFVESAWELEPAEISGNTYPGITGDRFGFGAQVVLSAHREMPPDHVAKILEVLRQEKSALAAIAPIYKSVNTGAAPLRRLAPYHPGAEKVLNGER